MGDAAVEPAVADIIRRLVTEPVPFHTSDGRPAVWNAMPGTLELLARVSPRGARTLETGCGASTVVLAARGARHIAISPTSDEHEAVRRYLDQAGIDADRVRFIDGFSDHVLPSLELDEPLDLLFIDGAHSFPLPMIDWHYASRLVRVGGVIVIDDVPIPSVQPVYRHMAAEPEWELLEIVDDRAAAFRKLRESPTTDVWRAQAINRHYPAFGFLPLRRRLDVRARHLRGELRKQAARRLPAPARRRLRALRRRG